MKICDRCGAPNYKIEIKNKKPVCNKCSQIMSEAAQCKPTRKNNYAGQPIQGETSKLYDEVTIKEIV